MCSYHLKNGESRYYEKWRYLRCANDIIKNDPRQCERKVTTKSSLLRCIGNIISNAFNYYRVCHTWNRW